MVVRVDGTRERAFFIAGKGDQAGRKFREFIPAEGALAFGRAEMTIGEETAEILVAGAGFDEDGEDGTILHGEFRAHDGSHAGFAGFGVKTRGTVNAIAVREGDGGETEFGGGFGEMFRKRATTQEAESTARMEFNIGRSGAHGNPLLSTG